MKKPNKKQKELITKGETELLMAFSFLGIFVSGVVKGFSQLTGKDLLISMGIAILFLILKKMLKE